LIDVALVDVSGKKEADTQVWCDISDPYIGWDSEVPEDCLFKMEHLLTKDAVADLADEARKIKNASEALKIKNARGPKQDEAELSPQSAEIYSRQLGK
jgi:hypothetical protein